MAVPAASALISSKFLISSTKPQLCNHFSINSCKQRCVPITCSVKFPTMEDFHDLTKRVLNCTQSKLQKSIPGSVKDFPWKKAGNVALDKLLVLGTETLKWSLVACFAFSFLSDVSYSIFRNKELVIPLGLFVGSLVAKYFDEILQEFVHRETDGGATWRLLGMSCFFIIVKFMSMYYSGGNEFLLHAGNGGLMQSIWNWRHLPEQDSMPANPADD